MNVMPDEISTAHPLLVVALIAALISTLVSGTWYVREAWHAFRLTKES